MFLFSVSDFLVFEMILFQIPKFELVSNISKFVFRNSQPKQRTHIGFLKNSNSKRKQAYPNKALNCGGSYHSDVQLNAKEEVALVSRVNTIYHKMRTAISTKSQRYFNSVLAVTSSG